MTIAAFAKMDSSNKFDRKRIRSQEYRKEATKKARGKWRGLSRKSGLWPSHPLLTRENFSCIMILEMETNSQGG